MVVVHRQPDDVPDFRGEPVEQIPGHADKRLDEHGPRLDGQGDEVAGNRARPGQVVGDGVADLGDRGIGSSVAVGLLTL